MKYSFNIVERIQLGNLIAQYRTILKGGYEKIIATDSLIKKLTFTVEELEKYGIKEDVEKRTFSWDKGEDKEIEVLNLEKSVLVDLLTQLNNEEQLNVSLVNVYETFVLNKGVEQDNDVQEAEVIALQ